MWKHWVSVALLAVLVCLPGMVCANYIGPSPLVPPPDGVYLTPNQVHAMYSGPGLVIVLEDIRHSGFSNIHRTPSGPNTIETFDSMVTGMASVNGSPFFPVSLTGPVTVELFNYSPPSLGTFNTEMLQLDLMGGGVLIRESPTLASTGQTTIADIGSGQFRIDSFFDIFTELSLDNGQTWIPSQGPPTHVELSQVPEPSTIALLGVALSVVPLMRRRWRRG